MDDKLSIIHIIHTLQNICISFHKSLKKVNDGHIYIIYRTVGIKPLDFTTSSSEFGNI